MFRSIGSKWALSSQKTRAVVVVVVVGLASATLFAASHLPNLVAFLDPSGATETFNQNGALDLSSPFFQSLGTNGRNCSTCHAPTDGWSVTPAHLEARFRASQGTDPIFRPVDGAVCPSADVSTVAARKKAYSMLLSKGVIRVSMRVPDGADFSIVGIDDPNCPDTSANNLALFRRPLPGTNLQFLTAVMWDGRETFHGNLLFDNLKHQALDATLGHAQASSAPTDAQLDSMVTTELGNYTGQIADFSAGILHAQGATGGAVPISHQQFTAGENDPFGGNFDKNVFTLFKRWENLKSSDATTAARASIARGEELFNTFPIKITGVAGLNDNPAVGDPLQGSCSTCHNTPNVGNHSSAVPLNIGVADYPARPGLDITGLPVYTIQCDNGTKVQTTDPGRALITGKCADIGKMKGPILRGLAARAPYFHNGSAATLEDVVEFYNQRFQMNLTPQQKQDLVAFLKAL